MGGEDLIELPEAFTLARQINETVAGKRVQTVAAAYSPHKFAWYYDDPALYHDRLTGMLIEGASVVGGMVEIKAETVVLLLADGVGLRYHAPGSKRREKHQLMIEFDDGSAVTASVQMYGGLWCFPDGEFDSPYYQVAREAPSPLSAGFDRKYFDALLTAPDVHKLSAKAFLATGQRIPGLGNGALQDILYEARIHPKRKMGVMSGSDREVLFQAVKTILANMALRGGRDTEKDLFGNAGGYLTRLSKNTVGKACPVCGEIVKKESYLGGSVYYCPGCQTL